MTKDEFFKLDIGIVVANRFNKDIYYVIYDNDTMGTAYRGKLYVVYGARQLNSDSPSYIRIDKGNCQFWSIEGKMK